MDRAVALVSSSGPRRLTVIVMSDRGLYARWLFQEIVALGWHPLMRITHLSKFRPHGSRSSLPVTAFVPKVGERWQGSGVAFPRKPCRRLDCTLLACWEPGYDEPWFVLTDLVPDQSGSLWARLHLGEAIGRPDNRRLFGEWQGVE